MRIRRARPEDLEAVGEVTVAAYARVRRGDGHRRLRRPTCATRPTRDREAELWVATPDDSTEILGTVTICPPGLAVARGRREPGEGEFRMLAVAPAARGAGRRRGAARPRRRRTSGARARARRDVDAAADALRPPASTSGSASSAARALTGRPLPGVDLIAYAPRPGADRERPGHGHPHVHGDRRRHRRGRRVGHLAGPRHAAPPGLVRGRDLRRCRAGCSATGETSVGTRVELEHARGSRGRALALEVTATPVYRDGRLHRLQRGGSRGGRRSVVGDRRGHPGRRRRRAVPRPALSGLPRKRGRTSARRRVVETVPRSPWRRRPPRFGRPCRALRGWSSPSGATDHRRTPWARPDASAAAARRRPPTTASAPTPERWLASSMTSTRSPRTGHRSGARCCPARERLSSRCSGPGSPGSGSAPAGAASRARARCTTGPPAP